MSYTIAVRALCEFTAKEGDLDRRFTPSPSGQEGTAGHMEVASRRPAHYETEISLTGRHRHLHVRGRADGYDARHNQLEEIKTYRGDLASMPENHRYLHWAQAKIYGYLLCTLRGLPELNVALVYFDIANQRETVFTETLTCEALADFFGRRCEQFLSWADQELAHRAARNEALEALSFPFADFRAGQRPLAEAVYKSARDASCILAQAPTGIGKTIGTLFPALKACTGQKIDRIFFLTAKTSGRQVALDVLGRLRAGVAERVKERASGAIGVRAIESAERIAEHASALPLRVLELVARDRACEHPDRSCHGLSCPLAKGFYDRLPQARQAAVDLVGGTQAVLDRETLRSLALAHGICPYYLGQELARWSDVAVGDYNHYFDTSAILYGLTLVNQWHVSVLVDEAHNMIERARKMATAELDQRTFESVARSAPAALKSALAGFARHWRALYRAQQDDYAVYDAIPSVLTNGLQQAITAIGDHLAQVAGDADPALLQFYFDALHFGRIAESFGKHSLFDMTRCVRANRPSGHKKPVAGSVLCVRNVIPARFLAPRFAAAHNTVLFSATLTPWTYYRDTLGLPAATRWLDVQSPFRAEQLAVSVVSHISTRFRNRDASVSPIVDLIAHQYGVSHGNYLCFCSSFDYLDKLASQFRARHPDLAVWVQSRSMAETDRAVFLSRFAPDSSGVGFAVLGGAFGEGIDLPGSRLIGAFIITLGLPQINPINQQIMHRMHTEFGSGFEYTYLYPGLQKVVQAAGRVIRTEQDKGCLYLIDDRYNRSSVKSLLPAWWKIGPPGLIPRSAPYSS